ncbi:hypothetical protein [Thermogymnomonas acidicola]|uniref:hypothetical protein n=1 Tax=Thermogymnomonas acidicola TaxID=399579 RepID=UPI00094644AB|nr:hypothetical protein [Thermogymnomonas acidicola]
MQPAPDLSHIAGDLSQWSLVRNLSVRGYSGRLYRLGTALVNRRMRQVITILVVSDPVNDRRKIAKFAYVSQDIMAYRRLVICCCGISEEEERAMSGMSLIAIRVPEPMCHHGDRGRGAYSIARDLILSSQEDRARAVRLKRSRTRVVLDILSFIRDAGRAVSITQITDAAT